MREYFTLAIVLGSKPQGEHDRIIDLYTKDLGRLQAKVVGGRKLTSKLSPHLELMNLVEVRLVVKRQFTVADAMVKEDFRSLKKDPKRGRLLFELLFLLKSLLPILEPDLRLWHSLAQSLTKEKISNRNFLKLLGYNPLSARCEVCSSEKISYFSIRDQVFLCKMCYKKFPSNLSNFLSVD